MSPKRVSLIVGTRPQIIKSAPVLKAAKAQNEIEISIINTGQHYDYVMNRQFFKELELPEPEVDLETGQGNPNEQVSRIISSLDLYLARSRPDLAIVPGDTNSALAAGIACSKLGIKLAHLEAGCRCNDFRMSEEINRRVLDHISHLLLCPTKLCYDNLLKENTSADMIKLVGDTMYDLIIQFMPSIEKSDATKRYGLLPDSYAFMTLHRAENVDSRSNIASIFQEIELSGFPVVFAVHPRTRDRINKFELKLPTNIQIIDPLPYLDTLRLIRDSKFVMTDSGGVQKESYWLLRPSLILRNTTEWIEIVQAGGSILVGSEGSSFRQNLNQLSNGEFKRVQIGNLFGDGHAAEMIAKIITDILR